MCLPVTLDFLQIIRRPSVPIKLFIEYSVNFYTLLYFYLKRDINSTFFDIFSR
jgi:hypothetical protein